MSGTTNFFPRSANTVSRPEIPAGDLTSTVDLSALHALAALGSDRESRATLLGVSAVSALLLADLVEHVKHLGKQQEIIAKVVKKLEHVTNSSVNGVVASTTQTAAAAQPGVTQEVTETPDLQMTVVLDRNSVSQFGAVITAGLSEALQAPVRELGQHAVEIVNALCKAVMQQETLQGCVLEVLGKMDGNSKRIDELCSAQIAQKSTQADLEAHVTETVRRLDHLTQTLGKMGLDVVTLADMTATVEREVVAVGAVAEALLDKADEDQLARVVQSPDRHPRSKKGQ